MALLPIWIESWEIACCGDAHVAETGKKWSEALMIGIERANPVEGELDRWWRPVDDGWVEFQARAEPVFEGKNRGVLLDFGSVRAFAFPEPALGMVAGKGIVEANWHDLGEPELRPRLECSGIVRSVRARPYVREPRVEGQLRRHEVGYDVSSTADLLETLYTDVLIELEVDRPEST